LLGTEIFNIFIFQKTLNLWKNAFFEKMKNKLSFVVN